MKQYLLPESGKFYKANLHCHTNISDGKKTPQQIKELYKNMGYSVVAFTDHDVFLSHNELTDNEFLALNGFEMEINEQTDKPFVYNKTCHICLIALDKDNIIQPFWHNKKYHQIGNVKKHIKQAVFDKSLPDFERIYGGEEISYIMQTAQEKGFFVTYNHPTWSMETYNEYINYNGMNAFEMFNGSCINMGYYDYNPRVYDDMLLSGKKLFCIGSDDNHNSHPDNTPYCDSGLAFTVIKAESLNYSDITKALKNGNFYASQAPKINALWYEKGKAYIECSDAVRIDCNFDLRTAQTVIAEKGTTLKSACFNISKECKYFRITVTDKHGLHACTNAYFTEELNR